MRKLFLLFFLLFITNQSFTQDSLKILSIKMDKQGLDADGDGYARFRVFTVEVEANGDFKANVWLNSTNTFLNGNYLLNTKKGLNTFQIAIGNFSSYNKYNHNSFDLNLEIRNMYGLLDSVSFNSFEILAKVNLESNEEDGGTGCYILTNTKLKSFIDIDTDNYSQVIEVISNIIPYYNDSIYFKFYDSIKEICSIPFKIRAGNPSLLGSHYFGLPQGEYDLSLKIFFKDELIGEIPNDELDNLIIESPEEDGREGLKLLEKSSLIYEDYDYDKYAIAINHYSKIYVNASNYKLNLKYYSQKENDTNWVFLDELKNIELKDFIEWPADNIVYAKLSKPYDLDSAKYRIKIEGYNQEGKFLFEDFDSTRFETAYQDLNFKLYDIDQRDYSYFLYSNGDIKDVHFFDKYSVFAGGFFLSGKMENVWWSNGIASASRINDYVAGSLSSNINNIFGTELKSFNTTWNKYRFAVDMGADYYDGNNNGIYDPQDLNKNYIWDKNEDAPIVYGTGSTLTIYNDGVPASRRRFNTQNPIGLEIFQSTFDLTKEHTSYLPPAFIIKYKIVNKSGKDLDSVIFSPWADPDLGQPMDDLVGTWLDGNGMYAYNKTVDAQYGYYPPAFLISLLQGPVVYKSGISFSDVNNDQVYSDGIDIPLDTAINYKGNLGMQVLPGAMNLGLSSTNHYIQSDPTLGDPNNVFDAVNYAKGLNREGSLMDPCSWSSGIVSNYDCNLINPLFKYSGDPISSIGWLNSNKTDQRIQLNTESFEIKKDSSVEIIIGYIGAMNKSNNLVDVITLLKKTYQEVIEYFNFPKMVADVNHEQVITNFEVYQNYPNPFNPFTNIKFNLAKSGLTKVKVFDLLGREIQVLVNDILPQGLHDIPFNGSKLSSGVYFYSVESDNNKMIKKMVLLK